MNVHDKLLLKFYCGVSSDNHRFGFDCSACAMESVYLFLVCGGIFGFDCSACAMQSVYLFLVWGGM